MKKIFDLTKDEAKYALEIYSKSIVVNALDACIFDDEYIRTIRDSGITATAMGIGGGASFVARRYKLFDENPYIIGPVTTVKEIRQAKERSKVAAIFNTQNPAMLITNWPLFEGLPSFDFLRIYHKLGLRILMPTYNIRNVFADGCDERTNCGLSKAGVELIEMMNKLNIIADCSHMGIQDTLDVCEYSKFPVCTHSNARAVCDNVRNRTDEEIKAIAEKGGVLGIVTFPTFVKWTKTEEGEKPTIEDVLDHIDYISNLVGVKHVGFGFDFIEGSSGPSERAKRLRPPRPIEFDPIATRPPIWGKRGPRGYWEYAEDIDDITKTSNMAKGLVARGYSESEIKGVLGENWLRVFKRAWGE